MVAVILYKTPIIPFLCALDLIPSHSARGTVIYGDMSTHFITQHSHRVSLCEEAKKQRKHKRQMGLIIMRTCITSSLLLRSSEFNSFSHFIPSSLSLFHTLCLPASLSLFLHFRPFCFAHIPSALANHSTRFKVWRWELTAPCVTSKPCSPSLEHPTVLSKKEQREIHV